VRPDRRGHRAGRTRGRRCWSARARHEAAGRFGDDHLKMSKFPRTTHKRMNSKMVPMKPPPSFQAPAPATAPRRSLLIVALICPLFAGAPVREVRPVVVSNATVAAGSDRASRPWDAPRRRRVGARRTLATLCMSPSGSGWWWCEGGALPRSESSRAVPSRRSNTRRLTLRWPRLRRSSDRPGRATCPW